VPRSFLIGIVTLGAALISTKPLVIIDKEYVKGYKCLDFLVFSLIENKEVDKPLILVYKIKDL
jgi:hypothetical protein